jgi:prepilin-type N-terminal cleavage/methylation domain-containing protein
MRKGPRNGRRGFTLVEMVVTVGIIAALAAIVYPTVVKQFDSADPARAAEDLNSITTGLEVFGVNVRPQQPRDIEDLVNRIRTVNTNDDSTARSAAYSIADSVAWNGPYLGISIPFGTAQGATVISSGFDASILNRLGLYDIDIGATGGDTTVGVTAATDFLAVRITGLSGAAFLSINSLIDGPVETTETLRRHSGRLRCPGAFAPGDPCTMAYYLASPIR